jgi:hypothetical protein
MFGIAILNERSAILPFYTCATVFKERLEVEGADFVAKSDKEGEDEGGCR